MIEARQAEHQKYVRTYRSPRYRMKVKRMRDATNDLRDLPVRGAYLDVSCGWGDMLEQAAKLGFSPVMGTEIVPSLIDGHRVKYAEVQALPFEADSFDVVTMFDVIEHLIPGDDELACKELMRVARHHIVITANNKPSISKPYGDILHINRRQYEVWDKLFGRWFSPHKVTWLKGERTSEAWRIDL